MNTCKIEDCKKSVTTRDWCPMHYQRWRKNGDSLIKSLKLPNIYTVKAWQNEYWAWQNMKDRCYRVQDAKYERYGSRGIKVCDRWLESFSNFCEDMGARPSSKHSIERIDNDGNYEPSNCKWATLMEQANNKSSNHFLTINGERKTLAQWAKFYGLNYHTVYGRLITYNWPIEKALGKVG